MSRVRALHLISLSLSLIYYAIPLYYYYKYYYYYSLSPETLGFRDGVSMFSLVCRCVARYAREFDCSLVGCRRFMLASTTIRDRYNGWRNQRWPVHSREIEQRFWDLLIVVMSVDDVGPCQTGERRVMFRVGNRICLGRIPRDGANSQLSLPPGPDQAGEKE